MAALMSNPDQRLSAGAISVLRNLTRSIPLVTTPILVAELSSVRKPSFVKAEIVRTLLESTARSETRVLAAIEAYLGVAADRSVVAANLHSIAASRFGSPGIAAYAIRSLDDASNDVKMAAIQAVYVLGPDVRSRARPALLRLAGDATDEKLRFLAERALNGTLEQPGKLPEPPEGPRLPGAVR
jgi:hypothetical protein